MNNFNNQLKAEHSTTFKNNNLESPLTNITELNINVKHTLTKVTSKKTSDCFTARDASSPAHASSSPLGGSTRRLRVNTFCVPPPWKVCTQLHVISVLTELLLATADDRTDSSHTCTFHMPHISSQSRKLIIYLASADAAC